MRAASSPVGVSFNIMPLVPSTELGSNRFSVHVFLSKHVDLKMKAKGLGMMFLSFAKP